MTREQIEPLLGKPCLLCWRDPVGRPGWTDSPLDDETARAETLCWPVGFNARGELIVSGSRCGDEDAGDRNAIPISLVESATPLVADPHKT